MKMNMQFELVNDVHSIRGRMTDDFAGGEKIEFPEKSCSNDWTQD